MKDLEKLRKSFEEYEAEKMRNTPIEQRLAGLTPEQVLTAFGPEQLAAGLAPEQRLAGLAPEQLVALLAQLPPEVLEAAAKKRSS